MGNYSDAAARKAEKARQGKIKILILNIVFFLVLFAEALLVPVLGLNFTVAALALAFIISVLYVYLT